MWHPTAARCVYNTFVRVLSLSFSPFFLPKVPRALNESLLSRAAIESSGVAEDALLFTPLYVTPRDRYTKKRIIPFVRARREYAEESFHLEARQVLVSRHLFSARHVLPRLEIRGEDASFPRSVTLLTHVVLRTWHSFHEHPHILYSRIFIRLVQMKFGNSEQEARTDCWLIHEMHLHAGC